jgi:hypothetical protein
MVDGWAWEGVLSPRAMLQAMAVVWFVFSLPHPPTSDRPRAQAKSIVNYGAGMALYLPSTCAAFKVTTKAIGAGRCTPGHFYSGGQAQMDYFLDESSRIAGSVPMVNVSLGSNGTWPGTQWRSQFFVRYYGYIKVRTAGAYTLFMTSSSGGSGGQCKGEVLHPTAPADTRKRSWRNQWLLAKPYELFYLHRQTHVLLHLAAQQHVCRCCPLRVFPSF